MKKKLEPSKTKNNKPYIVVLPVKLQKSKIHGVERRVRHFRRYHSTVRLASGRLVGFGRNSRGQLGFSNPEDKDTVPAALEHRRAFDISIKF